MLTLIILGAASMNAQVTIGNENDPMPGAVLDLQTTDNLGLLLPKIALTDVKVWAPVDGDEVPGMIVYTDGIGGVQEGVYVWTTQWDLLTSSTVSGTITVDGVTLNKNTLFLAVGGKETLVPTIYPADASNKFVTWSSSDPAVATVSSTGLVTLVSDGTATITVTTASGNKTDLCVVNPIAKGPGQDVAGPVITYNTYCYGTNVGCWTLQSSRTTAIGDNGAPGNYGTLYKHADAGKSGVCPTGYRLPTKAEYTVLIDFLKSSSASDEERTHWSPSAERPGEWSPAKKGYYGAGSFAWYWFSDTNVTSVRMNETSDLAFETTAALNQSPAAYYLGVRCIRNI